MTQHYETMIDLGSVALSDVEAVVEAVRGVAWPTLDLAAARLRVEFEVGDPDGIADMWDLRDVVEELDDQIAGYFQAPRAPLIPKPTLVRP